MYIYLLPRDFFNLITNSFESLFNLLVGFNIFWATLNTVFCGVLLFVGYIGGVYLTFSFVNWLGGRFKKCIKFIRREGGGERRGLGDLRSNLASAFRRTGGRLLIFLRNFVTRLWGILIDIFLTFTKQ